MGSTNSTPDIQSCNVAMGRAAATPTNMDLPGLRGLAGASMGAGSAWPLSACANRTDYVQSMVVGQDPTFTTVYGFRSAAAGPGNTYGSMNPQVMLPNNEIIYLLNGSAGSMALQCSGNRVQGDIFRVMARLSANGEPFASWYAASATFSSGSGNSIWNWPNGTAEMGSINWPSLNGATIYWDILR